jgi:succinate-semialdehyde dehydrogenase / glutarate-semialdehyde dehydrogenase
MITRKLGPALAAGCTAVIKPSEETPYTALALCKLADEVGIPAGVVNILPTGREDVQVVGYSLCKDPHIRKVSFTGSTSVGKWLAENSASTMKKISLELGGNAPFIVFDDADLEVAVKALIASKFRNAGQACIASNRIFVQENIYEKFSAALVQKVETLKVGHGTDPNTHIGPLINQAGLKKVIKHVDDSVRLGAKILTGGSIHHELNAKGGTFYMPTVLSTLEDVDYPFQLQETFGPLIPLLRFKTEAEVVKMANNTNYGLAAYVCTKDLGKAYRVSEALEFGMVGVNEGSISYATAPFGGIKDSGIGREGGRYGLEEYTQLKYICMAYGK